MVSCECEPPGVITTSKIVWPDLERICAPAERAVVEDAAVHIAVRAVVASIALLNAHSRTSRHLRTRRPPAGGLAQRTGSMAAASWHF